MHALAFDGPRRVRVTDVSKPTLVEPGDVLVRVTTAGIGLVELERYAGPDRWPGVTPGSGCVGVVEAISTAVRSLRLDDVVLVPPAVWAPSPRSSPNRQSPRAVGDEACPKPACPERSQREGVAEGRSFSSPRPGGERGLSRAEPRDLAEGRSFSSPRPAGERVAEGRVRAVLGRDLPGSHAGWIRVPEGDLNLVSVPDPANLEAQAAVVATTYASAARAADAVAHASGAIGLIGCDVAGLAFLAALLARRSNISALFAFDPVPGRLLMARRHGATTIALKPGVDTLAIIKSKLDGTRFDTIVISHAGRAMQDPVRFAGAHARVLLLDPRDIANADDMELPEGLRGEWPGWPTALDIARCLEEISTGTVDLLPLISHVFPMAEAQAAYELASSTGQGAIQVLLKP
ncbi:MAG: alcohol dehydrogenase catalytic domain-containing protein [Chloroflexi bacterium]|nr:alcohol dehydrogenase catalytic domain-containing protein [Chloroflexota bacterium]